MKSENECDNYLHISFVENKTISPFIQDSVKVFHLLSF
jgi:hypothetical protein